MKKLNRVVMFVLLGVGLVAMLPITGIYTHTSCEWHTTPTAKGHSAVKPGETLSLSVRVGDTALQKKLREGIEKGLAEKGVTKLVDNPVTHPRAQVVIEAMEGNWRIFWAPLKVKARVLVSAKHKDPDALDATIEVEGACSGLVDRDQWQREPLELVTAEALKLLLPP